MPPRRAKRVPGVPPWLVADTLYGRCGRLTTGPFLRRSYQTRAEARRRAASRATAHRPEALSRQPIACGFETLPTFKTVTAPCRPQRPDPSTFFPGWKSSGPDPYPGRFSFFMTDRIAVPQRTATSRVTTRPVHELIRAPICTGAHSFGTVRTFGAALLGPSH